MGKILCIHPYPPLAPNARVEGEGTLENIRLTIYLSPACMTERRA